MPISVVGSETMAADRVVCAIANCQQLYALLKNAEAESYATLAWSR
jgi:hypothetical protein